MAATGTSKAALCVGSQGQTWFSHGPTCHFFNVSRFGVGSLPRCCSTFRLHNAKTKTPAFKVRGCVEDEDFGVTEEDQQFVKVLRECQPYFSVHRGRVFLVVISAELVATPYLDPILKDRMFLLRIGKYCLRE